MNREDVDVAVQLISRPKKHRRGDFINIKIPLGPSISAYVKHDETGSLTWVPSDPEEALDLAEMFDFVPHEIQDAEWTGKRLSRRGVYSIDISKGATWDEGTEQEYRSTWTISHGHFAVDITTNTLMLDRSEDLYGLTDPSGEGSNYRWRLCRTKADATDGFFLPDLKGTMTKADIEACFSEKIATAIEKEARETSGRGSRNTPFYELISVGPSYATDSDPVSRTFRFCLTDDFQKLGYASESAGPTLRSSKSSRAPGTLFGWAKG